MSKTARTHPVGRIPIRVPEGGLCQSINPAFDVRRAAPHKKPAMPVFAFGGYRALNSSVHLW